jgi:DNA-binding MarR family transcriptional regulator
MNLRRAAQAVTDYYDRMMSASGLTVNQYSLLVHIEKTAPCTVSALARAMNLERTTLTRNLKPLMEKSLIRDASGAEERGRQLILSQSGYTCLEKALPAWEKAQRSIKNILGEKRVNSLLETSARLARAVSR